jgi:hypothetical protein
MSLVATSITAGISSGEVVTQNDTSATFPVSDSPTLPNITNGTGANAAQHVWHNTITVNSSGTTLDLTSLSGGLDGAARTFTKIKTIKISNNGAVVVNVGNAASNQWTGLCSSGTATLPINPGGFLWNHAPDANGLLTVDGSHKSLLIASVSSTASVSICIVGEGT